MLDARNSLLEVVANTNPTLAPKGESPLAENLKILKSFKI